MRDFDRVRDKIEILLEPRQVALLAAGTMLLCGGIFAVGFGVGRHSAPAATAAATLRDIDASAAVVAAAGPAPANQAPSAAGEVEFLFPSALSSRPARPSTAVPVVRPAVAVAAPKVVAEAPTRPVVAEPAPRVMRPEPAPRIMRPEPAPRVARPEPAPRASAQPAARNTRPAALAMEDESELEERPLMAARPAPAPVVVAPAPRVDLSPVAPRTALAAATPRAVAPIPPAPAAVAPARVAPIPVAPAPVVPASRAEAPRRAEPEEDNRPRFTLQLKAAKSQGEVDAFVRELSEKGVKAHTVLANLPGKGRVYRIRVGRFASRAEARKFQEDMVRKASLADGGFITEL